MAPIFDINLFRRYIRKRNLLLENRIISQIPHMVVLDISTAFQVTRHIYLVLTE